MMTTTTTMTMMMVSFLRVIYNMTVPAAAGDEPIYVVMKSQGMHQVLLTMTMVLERMIVRVSEALEEGPLMTVLEMGVMMIVIELAQPAAMRMLMMMMKMMTMMMMTMMMPLSLFCTRSCGCRIADSISTQTLSPHAFYNEHC